MRLLQLIVAIIVLQAPSSLVSATDDDELSLLFLIHRHGDRSPYAFPPKDPYKDTALNHWKFGVGMLTKEGKLRMYRLGQYLRREYSDFLSKDPYEVYSISSDVDRCIASAQLLLAGLYEPEGEWIWKPELLWQPMAIHTHPIPDDPILNLGSFCPTRKEERKRVVKLKENAIYQSEDAGLMKKNLMEEYGYDFSDPHDFYEAYSTLKIEKDYPLELPKWLDDNFEKLSREACKAELLSTETDKLKRLSVGVLIGHIVDKMKRRKSADDAIHDSASPSSETEKFKLFHYSTHDNMIIALLDTLGVYREQVNKLPEFGSTVLIEFYRNRKQRSNSIKLVFLEDPSDENGRRELKLTECLQGGETVCSFDKFDDLTLEYQLTSKEWFKECRRDIT